MSLVPLTVEREVQQAFDGLCQTLNRNCQPFRRRIGWPGGNGDYDIKWNPQERFWTMQEQYPAKNRHILLLGSQNPAHPARMLGIICEVNPPQHGINRRCAGIFLKNERDEIYLAHSGKIGGGYSGIGKRVMRDLYPGAWVNVSWPDKKASEALILGKIDSPLLPSHIAVFVREVQRIKEHIRSNATSRVSPVTSPVSQEPSFNPEFAGRRSGYVISSRIEADCDHGLIINSLADELRRLRIYCNRDRNRDLFVLGSGGAMQLLFEAKTEVTTSTIYQGIGQLLYHSVNINPRPQLVFVLPGIPDGNTQNILCRLGINVLRFGWQGSSPVFTNLQEILALIGASQTVSS